jgi:hypothetical protein
MIDFASEKTRLYGEIKASFDPLFSAHQFKWAKLGFWVRDLGWSDQRCSLGIRQPKAAPYLELIGGAGIFVKQWHPIFQPDFRDFSTTGMPPASIGGPIHWIDQGMGFDEGRFTTFAGFQQLIPRFTHAITKRVLPELDRLKSEDSLLDALLDSEWTRHLTLGATQDRRAALATLMLSKKEGLTEALRWGSSELKRIKEQEPGQHRPGRWQELQRAIQFLEKS